MSVSAIMRKTVDFWAAGFSIRHQGFLANRYRKEKVELCRDLLAAADPATSVTIDSDLPPENPAPECPACKKGRLVRIRKLSACELAYMLSPNVDDTS